MAFDGIQIPSTESEPTGTDRGCVQVVSIRGVHDGSSLARISQQSPDGDVLCSWPKNIIVEQEIYSHPDVYDALYRSKDYEGEVEFVLAQLKKRGIDGTTALVVGCGTGTHSVHLRRRGLDVLGVDPNPEMIDRAREKSDATFRVDSLPDLEVEGKFDLVWAPYNVIEYVSCDEVIPAVQSLANTVAEPGILVLDAGEVETSDSPSFRMVNGSEETCAQLFQYVEIDEMRARMDAIVFTSDDWFFDRHTLLNVPDETIASTLREAGFDVTTHDGYGPEGLYHSTVFLASL